MNKKSLILNEIKSLKVNFFTFKDLDKFFNHLKIKKEDVLKIINELIKNGELVHSKNKLSLPEKAGFIKGTIEANSKGYAFLKVGAGLGDYFISYNNLKNAMHKDIVLASIVKNRKGPGKQEAKVEKIIKRGFETVVGTFNKGDFVSYVTSDDDKFLRDIEVSKDSSFNAKNGDKVVVKINYFGSSKESSKGDIVEVLGNPDAPGVDVLSVARAHNLTEKFPEAVLEEANALPDSVDRRKYPKRKYFSENIITIDGEDTRDIDDAISLQKEGENYRLWVHIADVNEYVKHDSLLDQEAFRRGTSVYFPNIVLPMLPVKLSNGICSLNAGEDRLVLTCEVLLDKEGKIINSDIYESIICSNYKMTYTGVTKILKGNKEEQQKYKPIVPMLFEMEKLGLKLHSMRQKRGALDFEVSEPYIKVDENGKTIDITRRKREHSDMIIESFMICANEAIAEKFFLMDIPFVYRVHEAPDESKVRNFSEFCKGFGEKFVVNGDLTNKQMQNFLKYLKGKPYETIVNKMALRTMQKARYADMCIGHYGLASKFYCHYTSPIRRYPDLTIHRIIKWYLNNELYNINEDELKSFTFESAEQSSITEREAEITEREVDDMKKTEYMVQFIGQSFNGIISGVTNFGIFVELENTCEGMIALDTLPGKPKLDEKKQIMSVSNFSFRLGDKVKVKLINSSPYTKEIDFIFENLEKIKKN